MDENAIGDKPAGNDSRQIVINSPSAEGSSSVPPPPVHRANTLVVDKKSDTLGTVGLIVGIVAVLLACCAPLGITLGIAAIICGIIAKSQKQRFAIAGVVLGVAAILFANLFLFLGSLLLFYFPNIFYEYFHMFNY